MKPYSWLLLVSLTFAILFSCGKHVYVLNVNELNKLATAARNPEIGAFVIYNTGDNVKGKVLK